MARLRSGAWTGWALGVALLGLCVSHPLAAQEMRFGDVVIERLVDLPTGKVYGYHEYRFELRNLSPDDSHRVTLRAPAEVYSNPGGLNLLEASATVPPAATVRLSLMQPNLRMSGQDLDVYIDGTLQRRVFSWHPEHPFGRLRSYSGTPIMSSGARSSSRLLVGRRSPIASLPGPETDEESDTLPVELEIHRALAAIDQWSGVWLAYSGFDGILLSWEEMMSAPQSVRQAIWAYVDVGGSLVLVDVPTGLLERAGREPVPGALQGYGRALRLTSGRGAETPSAETSMELAWQYLGFGELLLAPSLDRPFSDEELRRLGEAWDRTRGAWNIPSRDDQGARRLPVVQKVHVPIRGLFLFVLLYSILIGPVHLWWLGRKKRRAWILWTLPLGSLLACGLVVLVAMISEGVRHEARGLGVTVLDQGRQRASTLAWSGYYSSLAGDGLRYARDTQVGLLGGGGRHRRLVLGEDQHLASGWLAARLPSYFVERRHELRRERLEVTRTTDGLRVVNGLGADLDWLLLADAEGRLYDVDGLAAGAEVVLQPTGEQASGKEDGARHYFHHDLPILLRQATQQGGDSLRPGTYMATSRQGPFMENALAKARSPRYESLIYGLLEDAP